MKKKRPNFRLEVPDDPALLEFGRPIAILTTWSPGDGEPSRENEPRVEVHFKAGTVALEPETMWAWPVVTARNLEEERQVYFMMLAESDVTCYPTAIPMDLALAELMVHAATGDAVPQLAIDYILDHEDRFPTYVVKAIQVLVASGPAPAKTPRKKRKKSR